MLYLYSALIFSYFLSLFVDWTGFPYVIGSLAILSWGFSYKDADRLFKSVGTIFMIIGTILFFYGDNPLTKLPLYFTSTVIILAIFFVLPFINSIIIVGRYDKNVNKLLKARVNHLGQLYYRGSIVTFLLGTFLNIATLPLVETVLKKNVKKQSRRIKNLFISRSMLRAYALCLVWSPMEILVAISVEITSVSYLTYLPWLLGLAFLMLFIDWILGFRFKTYPIEKQVYEEDIIDKNVFRKIAGLLFYLILFIIAIIFTKGQLQAGFLEAVAITVLPYSILWAISIKRFRSYLSYSIPVWKKRTLGLKSYTVLFLSVGFFTTTLNETAFMGYIRKPFELLTGTPLFLFLLIQILFLGLAMVGFHPLVTISILGGILGPIVNLVNPMSLGIVLISSGISTVMAGPYNISVSLTGTLLHLNPYRISLWNLGYAFLFSSIGTLIALLLL